MSALSMRRYSIRQSYSSGRISCRHTLRLRFFWLRSKACAFPSVTLPVARFPQAVFDAARGPWSVVHPPLPDPTAVALDRRVVQLAPRRAARLQLSFSAAPVVVDELSVSLPA